MSGLRFKQIDAFNYEDRQFVSLGSVADYGKRRSSAKDKIYVSTEDLLKDFGGVRLNRRDQCEGIDFTKGDILLGNIRPYLRKMWLANCDGLCSSDVLVIRSKGVPPAYLFSILSSNSFFQHVAEGCKGSKMPRGDKKQILEFSFRLHDNFDEQQKIAAFFTALDRRIENCEKRLVTLEQLKKGVLQKMLSSNSRTLPEIRFKGFEGSWKAYKLSEVLDEIYVGQTPRRNHKEFWNGAINWLSSRDLTRGFVEETAEKITNVGMKSTRLRIVPNGTVVIAMIGLDAENTRGNCGILKIESTINQSCAALIPKKDKIIPEFLFHWYRFFGNDLALHYTQGTKQQNYNVDILSILPIHIPSLEEQKKISAILSTLDEQIVNGEKTKNNLIRLKNGLLQQMFI